MYPYHNTIKKRIKNGELIGYQFVDHYKNIDECLLLTFSTPPFERPIRPHKYHEYVDILAEWNRKKEKKLMSKEQYDTLDKLNLCHKCHKEKRMPGYKLCPICIEKHINYNIEHGQWRANHKEEYSKKCKERYLEHKQNGICVKCNSPATHGIYCYKHSIAARRYSIKQNERRKAERHEKGLITEKRIKEHLCYKCGKPLDNSNFKICNECRTELSRRSKLGNKDGFRKIKNGLFWENKK